MVLPGPDDGETSLTSGATTTVTAYGSFTLVVICACALALMLVALPLAACCYVHSHYPGKEGLWFQLKTTHSNLMVPFRYVHAEVRAAQDADLRARGRIGGSVILASQVNITLPSYKSEVLDGAEVKAPRHQQKGTSRKLAAASSTAFQKDPRDHALAWLATTDSKTRRWPESLNDEMLSI